MKKYCTGAKVSKKEQLLSPFPGLQSEVVMSSWGKQLVIDSVPDEGISAFIDRYKGEGPEPGAPCTDGVGQPLN